MHHVVQSGSLVLCHGTPVITVHTVCSVSIDRHTTNQGKLRKSIFLSSSPNPLVMTVETLVEATEQLLVDTYVTTGTYGNRFPLPPPKYCTCTVRARLLQ